jgi:hypothetical protein
METPMQKSPSIENKEKALLWNLQLMFIRVECIKLLIIS